MVHPSAPEQSMRVASLEVKKFRGIKNASINFGNSNLSVLIGINGVGKSSLLNSLSIGINYYVGLMKKAISYHDKQESQTSSNPPTIVVNNGGVLENIQINVTSENSLAEAGRFVQEGGPYIQDDEILDKGPAVIELGFSMDGENTSLKISRSLSPYLEEQDDDGSAF